MKTLKTLLLLFIICAAFACTKTNSKGNDDIPLPGLNKTGTTLASKSYQNFPVMVDLKNIQNNRDVFQEYISKNKISEAAADPSVTWGKMDELFQKISDKPDYAIQYVGYIILAKKDLIAEEGSTALKVKKNYVEQLINTGYRGYGVLYYSLNSLAKNSSYKSFVMEAVGKIIQYSSEDKEAKTVLGKDLSTIQDESTRRIQQKLKSNFEYIEKIASDFKTAS